MNQARSKQAHRRNRLQSCQLQIEAQHRGAISGAQDFVLFGRNEPALHHYPDTYRAALGLPLLERI